MEDPSHVEAEEETVHVPRLPLSRHLRFAQAISRVAEPPVVAFVAQLLIAARIGTRAGWIWAGISLAVGLLLPVFFIFAGVRAGRIGDLDIYARRQRYAPYVLSIATSALVFAAMSAFKAPALLWIYALAGLLQLSILFVFNLRWKISNHTATVSSLAVLLIYLFGVSAAPAALLPPLVAWSRVVLHRHTPAEAAGGIAVGAAVTALCLFGLFPT